MTTAMSVQRWTELRCPMGPKKLLAKIRSEGEGVVQIRDNLLELSCRDCTHLARRQARELGVPEPVRILHRFDLGGELVETVEGD